MTIYLYVKTHNKTGLRYLGKTISKDPHLYPGSGLYWTRHLKEHGFDYTTEILKECQTSKELKEWGIYYSQLWNIVDSDQWANLKPEDGDGGCKKGIKRSEQWREKLKNKVWTEKALTNLKNIGLKSAASRKGKSWTKNMRNSVEESYIKRNLKVAPQAFALVDANFSILQISKKLNISWDRVKKMLDKRSEFENRNK